MAGRWRRVRRILLPLVVVGGVLGVVLTAGPLGSVRWGFLPALGVLSVLHYVLAAMALRGVAGCRLPWVETTLAQFTAAAANRVTPGGFGASAVNARYLVCRGVPTPRAIAAVAMLHVVGGLADLLLFVIVAVSCGGGDGAVHTLGSEAMGAVRRLPLMPLLALAGLLGFALVVWCVRAGRSGLQGAARAIAGMAELLRRPGDLILSVTASGLTTFVLALAFALSVLAIPGAAQPGDTMALLIAYLIGAAAGGAVPVPSGIGSTEAALVAALVALGIPAAAGLQAVLLFRAITFWAPVPIGLCAMGTLRRRTAPATP